MCVTFVCDLCVPHLSAAYVCHLAGACSRAHSRPRPAAPRAGWLTRASQTGHHPGTQSAAPWAAWTPAEAEAEDRWRRQLVWTGGAGFGGRGCGPLRSPARWNDTCFRVCTTHHTWNRMCHTWGSWEGLQAVHPHEGGKSTSNQGARFPIGLLGLERVLLFCLDTLVLNRLIHQVSYLLD